MSDYRPKAGETENQKILRLLRNWAAISKGLSLTTHSQQIAEYDDELASMLTETAEETLEWRDRPS